MRISGLQRPMQASARLELPNMRKLTRSRDMWSGVGVVYAEPGQSHFRIVTFKDGRRTVIVDVELQPSRITVMARLAAVGGVWRIPDVGDEVAVSIPEGRIEFMPVITGTLSEPAARVSDTRTVIEAPDAIEVTAPQVLLGPDAASITEQVIKGTTYRTQETAMLQAMAAQLTVIGAAFTKMAASAGLPAAATENTAAATAATAMVTAITNFEAQAATYLSTNVKVK